MSRHSSDLKKITALIEELGGKVDRIRLNKHTHIYWRLRDRKFIQTIPMSPGSTFGLQQGLSDIKRNARQALTL